MARFKPLILLMFIFVLVLETTRAGSPKLRSKQPSTDVLFPSLFKQWADSLKPVVDNPSKYELQIIFTRIHRDASGLPRFEPHRYRVKKRYYFYPASLVKLPVSILALTKLDEYQLPGLDRNTTVFTDSAAPCQQRVHADSTAETALPSMGNYIKRMMLVSDNFSYSRVYEFLGRDFLKTELNRVGLSGTRIVHRFDGNCSFAQNGVLNPMTFLGPRGDTLLRIPLRVTGLLSPHPLGRIRKGRGQQLPNGRVVRRSKDFTQANYLSLEDADGILKRLVMPEAFAKKQRFRLSTKDRDFLLSQMGKWPRESIFPHYPDSVFEDSHKKYLVYGDVHGKINSDSIRIFNVVGLSYGYMSDCAYVIDAAQGVEFFISVSLYVNSDGIINDGKYEYQQIGFPFLSRLGRILYRMERDRPKKIKPDLNHLINLIKTDSL